MEKLDLQKIKYPDLHLLQEKLSNEWGVRVFSLFLAILLWNFVGGEDRVNMTVSIPVEVVNLPRDLVISNQFKEEIEVTVSGPRSSVMNMKKSGVSRQIDLSSASSGTIVVKNDNNSINVSRGIDVLRIRPSSIILSMDKLIQKHLPVKPVLIGKPVKGYEVKSTKMLPGTVSITGPNAILSSVDVLLTNPINVTGLRDFVQLQVPLDLDWELIDLIGETSVTAELYIGLKSKDNNKGTSNNGK